MIEEVVTVAMPVSEKIVIRKNRIMSENLTDKAKRLSIVTGIHGDELDGQYICYELNRRINEHIELLDGIVDIYPAVNPLGIESCTRGMPMFDLDMNRVFPGIENGATAEYLASKIVNDIIGSDMCVDLHSSNIFIKETPQVRVFDQFKDKLMPYAYLLNADFIWEYKINTVLEATLAHSLNSTGTPCLVVELGVGQRINHSMCRELVAGIFNLMREMGVWHGPATKQSFPEPKVCKGDVVSFLNADTSGVFLTELRTGVNVKKGDILGTIVDPLAGKVLSEVRTPTDGFLFTIRAYPIVYEGSLMARIFNKQSEL